MKKGLTLVLSILLIGITIVTSGCNRGPIDIPTFEKSEGMKFVAYSGPTIANWDGGAHNVNSITDEHFQMLVDAGFTGLHAMHEGNASKRFSNYEAAHTRSVGEITPVIEMCEKYGITYYVKDADFYGLREVTYDDGSIVKTDDYDAIIKDMFMRKNEDGSYFNTYINSSAYGGNLCDDEPLATDFDNIKYKIELYNKYLEERGVSGIAANVNLLPSSASNVGAKSYTQYIEQYLEKLGPLLGYISYDNYPLQTGSKGSSLAPSYLANLELIARLCKEYEARTGKPMELRTFVQAGGESGYGKRELTSIADFRFQIYTEMAFGTRNITYYEYGRFFDQDESDDYVIMDLQHGTYNWSYEAVKQVNNEVHAFEDAYLSFEYDGIMTFTPDPTVVPVDFYSIKSHALSSHNRIKSVTVSQNAILSSFKNSSGDDAFMLVNYTDPYLNQSNEVTIKFNDARAILMYRFGQAEVVTLNKGSYTFELYPGEGRFIIPLK